MCVCVCMDGGRGVRTSLFPYPVRVPVPLSPNSCSCLSCSSPLSIRNLLTHPCHLAVQFLGISFFLCLQPCSSYLHLLTAKWQCFMIYGITTIKGFPIILLEVSPSFFSPRVNLHLLIGPEVTKDAKWKSNSILSSSFWMLNEWPLLRLCKIAVMIIDVFIHVTITC